MKINKKSIIIIILLPSFHSSPYSQLLYLIADDSIQVIYVSNHNLSIQGLVSLSLQCSTIVLGWICNLECRWSISILHSLASTRIILEVLLLKMVLKMLIFSTLSSRISTFFLGLSYFAKEDSLSENTLKRILNFKYHLFDPVQYRDVY